MSAWQPIETAPRDGAQVMIAGGTVEYDAECFPVHRPFGGVHIASWDEASHSWSGPYGSEYDAQYWHSPTHWMPLPAAPVTA